MVFLVEVSLLSLMSPKGNFEVECSTRHNKPSLLPSDSSPVTLSVPSLSASLTISLRSNQSVLSSSEQDLKSLFSKFSESTKTFTFLHAAKRFQAKIHFKQVNSSCSSCQASQKKITHLEQQLQLLQKSQQTPPFEHDSSLQDKDLNSMLQKSYEARQEMQQLLKETTECSNLQIDTLNSKVKQLFEDLEESENLLFEQKELNSLLELELEEIKAYNKRLTSELENTANRLEEAANCLVQQPFFFSEENADFPSQIEGLEEDKIFLNNEVLRLKEELTNTLSQSDELKEQAIQAKNEFFKLKNSFAKQNSELNLQLSNLKTQNQELVNENNRLEELNKEIIQNSEHLTSEIKTFVSKNKTFQGQILDLEHKIVDVLAEKELIQKELSIFRDPSSIDASALSSQIEILKSELQSTMKNNTENSKLYEDQLANFSGANRDLTESLNACKKELASKQLQIKKLTQENDHASAEIAKLEQYLCVSEDLNQLVDDLKLQNEGFKSANEKLEDEVSSMSDIISLQSTRNQAANNQIEKLTIELSQKENELALKEKQLSLFRKQQDSNFDIESYPPRHDNVDRALSDYLEARVVPLDTPFIQEDFGIYTFGNKRVFLKVDEDDVFVKYGGKEYFIEEFLSKFSEDRHIKPEPSFRLREEATEDISPKKAARIVKDQLSQGKFTSMYAKRTSTPILQSGFKRTNSLKKFADF